MNRYDQFCISSACQAALDSDSDETGQDVSAPIIDLESDPDLSIKQSTNRVSSPDKLLVDGEQCGFRLRLEFV